MAEAVADFVARRRPRWRALEASLDALAGGRQSLPGLLELERQYREATSDLAMAQSRYGGTDVERFLNQLCARAYGVLYRRRGSRWAALKAFYLRDFPALVRETLGYTRAAAGVLLLGVVLGASTIAINADAAQTLVDVNVRQWVASKSLWTDAALSMRAPSEMATAIFLNNLRVAILAFALGVTFGAGTVLILLLNGLNVGALTALCVKNGLGPGIFGFMAAHGPVELSIIALCGGAGLLMGSGLVAPGEQPRLEALQARAARSVRLVLGCAPFLVAVGVVEGFVSPGALFPWWARAALGLGLFVAFWGYLLRCGVERAPAR